jgi:predicted DNA-binding transcriptional regulator AlpA
MMKFLSDADLRECGIRLSGQHRDRLIKANKFPKPGKPGDPNGVHAWIETEIEEYQKRCVGGMRQERGVI